MCNEIDFAEFADEILYFIINRRKNSGVGKPWIKREEIYNIILGNTYGRNPVIDDINAYYIAKRILDIGYNVYYDNYDNKDKYINWRYGNLEKVLGSFILTRYKELKGVD